MTKQEKTIVLDTLRTSSYNMLQHRKRLEKNREDEVYQRCYYSSLTVFKTVLAMCEGLFQENEINAGATDAYMMINTKDIQFKWDATKKDFIL